MAAIELLRMGLEMYESFEAAEEAEERSSRERKIQGLREVYWWEEMGVRPKIKLVGKTFWGNFTTLDTGSEQAYRVINEEMPAEDRPEYSKVVVDDVEPADLQTVVAQFYLRFMTMADWIEAMGNPDVNDRRTRDASNVWFLRQGDGTWLVKLWNSEENNYKLYSKPAINQPLNELMTHLNLAQQEQLNELAGDRAGKGTVTVADTAWFGTDREVFVYNSFGSPEEIDFEDVPPKFVRIHTTDFAYRIRGNMALVRAADEATYRVLSRFYWITESSQLYMDASGTHHEYYLNPNSSGYAYVLNSSLR